ncbi:hypothetical protein [Klebsiella variicola]|uniref:hypothetical protein n=1 Tax=Klebsiella variicola TaxID=244366 RepID=UPI0015A7594E|nr:hypothetical protein [Klebsiella variicola]
MSESPRLARFCLIAGLTEPNGGSLASIGNNPDYSRFIVQGRIDSLSATASAAAVTSIRPTSLTYLF